MRRGVTAVVLLTVVGAAVLSSATTAGASSPPPVTGLHAVAVNGPGVTLSWRWPSSKSARKAIVVYSYGRRAPASPLDGDEAGVVPRSRHGLSVYGLVPQSRYSFAVFTEGRGSTSPAATISVRTGEEPRITSTSLPDGVVATPYTAHLTVANSDAGTWAVDSGQLPMGLTLSGATISGTPQTAGTSSFVLRYVDRHGARSYCGTSITVSGPEPTPAPTPTPTP